MAPGVLDTWLCPTGITALIRGEVRWPGSGGWEMADTPRKEDMVFYPVTVSVSLDFLDLASVPPDILGLASAPPDILGMVSVPPDILGMALYPQIS